MNITTTKILSIAITLLSFGAGSLCYGLENNAVVIIDPTKKHQTIEGWGVSLCWWAHMAGKWPEAKMQSVVTLLTDEKRGLGYNIFRYNIGGGDRPGHDHMEQRARIEGYKASPSAAYNWSADASQRRVLAAIIKRNPKVILEAFANSPPWWMTISRCAAGEKNGRSNLRDDQYDSFADYLTDVVKHFRDKLKINFRTLEPLNEPSAWWWKESGRQEGCKFTPAQQARILKLTAAKLKAKGLIGTSVSGTDENAISSGVKNIGGFDRATIKLLSQLNVHSYHGQEHRKKFAALAAKLGKKVWMSEGGPLKAPVKGRWPQCLWMAQVVISDLRDLKAVAWIDWQAIDIGTWGTLNPNWKNQSFKISKRFYSHAHFSRFIRPGYTIVNSNNPATLAALSPNAQKLIVVAVNQDAKKTIQLNLSRFRPGNYTAAIHTTTSKVNLQRKIVQVRNGILKLNLPPQSIATVEVSIR
ncbi:MAG: alpha-L-arabinofuranosidase [Phycisphaerales bacterium]|jgi:O-glycosyl hydrolase|nr:alpha-L-arabinofuranosidase [Phycisphaerales bacterium]